jgi:FKBP-type peptidyl-prolyl cis-trans isomerase
MKNVYIWGAVGIIILAGAHYMTTKSKDVSNTSNTSTTNTTTMSETTIGGMKVVDEVVGTGDEAVTGSNVTVHYVGTLTNGTVFDASRNHGNDGFTFALGAGQVIKGWDEGVKGMKVGGKRKLTIPPEMAYGSRAIGNVIPANSTLVFEVELLKVAK